MKNHLFDILFSFAFFSVLGWVMETCYRSLREGRFVNPGLLKGPYLILYGGAALILTAAVPIIHGHNIFVKALCYFVITTGLELVSGFNARHFFNIRLWDYSAQRFQLYGHVCLKFSICWILLAFAFEYLLLPAYLGLTSGLSLFFKGIFGLIGVMSMAADFFRGHSGKTATRQQKTQKEERIWDGKGIHEHRGAAA